MPRTKELNLLCMSGQGSVQSGEVLAKLYSDQGQYVSVNVYPGTRARSAPVINYVKISDSPGLASCANYRPEEVIVFQEELLLTAKENSHELIADAIGRMKRGVLLVNSPKHPSELDLPFDLEGVVATVDATEIAERLLKRTPPPVGITMLGAYSRITEAVDMAALSDCIRENFSGRLGDLNAQAALEAYEKVQAIGGVKFQTERRPSRIQHAEISSLPQYYSFDRYDKLPGFRQGSPFVWRDKVPVCNDAQCICPSSCISEVMCPDGTGFIVREGLSHQGYRIDVEFCRGCGICAEVCVGSALTMVDEDTLRKEKPAYEDVTVEPHWPEVSTHQRAGMEAPIPLRLRQNDPGQGRTA